MDANETASRLEKIALIESLLFVSKEPVEIQRLMEFLGCGDAAEFAAVVKQMEALYAEQPTRGIQLRRAGGGLQLVTKPDFHESLRAFFTVKQKVKLTLASLETLSIVAYQQPVTLAEIAALRGVNPTAPVRTLLEKGLIVIAGRKKVPGLPALYATSKEFLTYFGLNELGDLPSLDELSEFFEEKEQPSLFDRR